MKAILVINNPNYCYDCPCYYEDKDKCEVRNQRAIADIGIPSWCPLKPLPHKLQADWYTDGYKEGFNACLDEITDHIGESTEKFCNDDLYESWMFFDEGETE